MAKDPAPAANRAALSNEMSTGMEVRIQMSPSANAGMSSPPISGRGPRPTTTPPPAIAITILSCASTQRNTCM